VWETCWIGDWKQERDGMMASEQGTSVGAQGSEGLGSVWKWYQERSKPSRGHGETRERRRRILATLWARTERGFPDVFEGDPALRATRRRIRRAANKWDDRRAVARRPEPANDGRACVRELCRVAFNWTPSEVESQS
jgi:hypothetical protein